MHGAGNDYIYVNTIDFPLEHPEELAIKWSAPHTGIGADGLVLIGISNIADFSMRIFNADGSEALMCGNASRCIGKYVYEKGLTTKQEVTLETLSGIKKLQLHLEKEIVASVTVDMGVPSVKAKEMTIEANGTFYKGTVVSIGNPHYVLFTDDVMGIDLPTVGPSIEHHPAFPDRTNVEFVQVLNDHEVRMRVWERGSGITQACGTGACATLVAAVTHGKTAKKGIVHMDGGPLTIEWSDEKKPVYMTGEAVSVFEGTIEE